MDASPSKTGSEAGRHPRRFERRLRRKPTESWGIEFTDTVFDRMILCHNDCVFCFMKMLPKGMRNTLYLRDDDYRLSFLQGNFVTLTNMGEQDVRRIIEEGLSPLHVSVHAITPSVRESIMGKNAAHGIEVLERLLDAGIEAHAQIVLMPGENDGDELDRTLSWLEQRPGIISCGIVPLGYTRFQTRFDHSFNDPAAAAAVIDQVEPYRVRSREATGLSRFFLADEFYLNAGRPMPPSDTYDGFEQYEDGIGMIRSFEDEWDGLEEEGAFLPFEEPSCAPAPADATRMVCGVAFARWFDGLLLTSPLAPHLKVLGVENDYFGGNVDVTGLLCGCDVLKALAGEREAAGSDFPVILPRAMFNADRITLDGMTADDLSAASGLPITVVSCNAEDIVTTLMRRIAGGGSRTEGMV